MEKWIGVIIAAVFIIALGAILFTIFHKTIHTIGGNIKTASGNVIDSTENFISMSDKTIEPQHFQGIIDGFNSVLNTVK